MASLTVAQFRLRLDEFENVTDYPDDLVQMIIDDTESEMAESVWGDFFHRGQAFLVGHYLALRDIRKNGQGSEGGQETLKPIAAESEGDTSVTYVIGSSERMMSGAGKDDLLASTLYGQQFIELRSKAIIGVASSGTDMGSIARQTRRRILPDIQ